MAVNPHLRAAQLALNSTAAYRKFIRIDESPTGEIGFTNVATGATHNNMGDAIAGVDSLGLVDYRLFTPRASGGPLDNFASTSGVNQLDSEIQVINKWLREAVSDPAKMRQLRDVGLGHLAGQPINGRFLKFNTRGQEAMVRNVGAEFPLSQIATASLTDEGYTLMQYAMPDGTAITGRQSKLLQSVIGVGQIQSSFIEKLIKEDEYSSIAKLAKRLQSTMSPRDVMLGEEFIQRYLTGSIIDDSSGVPITRAVPFESRVMSFDGVAGQLEIMLRDRGAEGAGLRPSAGLAVGRRDVRYGDRVIGFSTTPGYRLTDQEKAFVDAGALGDDLAQKDGLSRIDSMDQRLTLRRKKLLDQMSQTYGFSDAEMNRVSKLWEEATIDAASDTGAGTDAEKILKAFKVRTKALFDDQGGTLSAQVKKTLPITDYLNRKLQDKIGIMLEGLEKSRDGQYMITPTALRQMKSAYEAQLEALLGSSSGAAFTNEQVQNITALQKQIEAFNKALQKVGEGDIIARVNLGFGQIKGEAYIVPERIARQFMSGPLDDLMPFIITDKTNIKGEVGSALLRNIGLNIGENKPGVYSDPLMFLYHGEYFSQPAMIDAMRENAMASISKGKEFMTTGDIPEEILKELEEEMSAQIGGKNLASRLKLDSDLLDPVSKASYMRRRQEAQEIMNALRSGVDPRQIPQLVRRINDFYNAKVVRLKNGRADVIIPTAEAFSLRTLESSLDQGRGFSPGQSIGVDLSSYGVTTRATNPIQLNFVNFRIDGKRMLLSGEAAYKYQHSLGGFDLDDKGIPLMSTFEDSSGRKRLVFMTLRQPTSFQESLAMTADLTDRKTVNALFKNNSRFKEALADDTVLSNLGIDKRSRQYQNLVKMVTGNGRIDGNIDYNAIEDMMIRISESTDVFPGRLPSLTTSKIIRMAMSQDASALGLGRMTSAGSPISQMMQEVGLNPSQTPVAYDSETIFQIFRKKQEAKLNTEVLQKISSELGITLTSETELLNIMNKTGPLYRDGMEHQVSAIMKEFIEGIMARGATSTVDESIGLFINRQAAAVNVLESSRAILESEFGITSGDRLFEEFQNAASIFTLPASEAVDYSKQISLEQVLTNFGSALARVNAETGISADVVEETLRAYMRSAGEYTENQVQDALVILDSGGIKLRLDPLGQQMLRSHAGVGFVRAKQIAEQIATTGSVDRSALLGLQQTIYDDTLGYARVKNLDQPAAATETLRGLAAYLDSSEGRTLSVEQREAIEAEVATIRAAGSGAKQIESLFMAPGTQAYDRFAQHDQLVRSITDIQTIAATSKSSNIADSRRLKFSTDPVVKTKFQTQSKNIVEDIQSNLKTIQSKVEELRGVKTAADSEVFNIRAKRIETLRSIYERMSAVKSAEISAGRTFTGADMLDLADSVEAQMARFMDTQEAAKVVTSELISEDDRNITFMMELFGAARKRRLAVAQKDRIDLHKVARVDSIYAGPGVGTGVRTRTNAALRAAGLPDMPASIADVSVEQANEAIKSIRTIRKTLPKGTTPASVASDLQILSELMSRIKDGGVSGARLSQWEGASDEAASAFSYHFQGSRSVIEAEQTAANLVANGLLADADIPAAAVDAATRAATSATRMRPGGTVYKRIGESFRTGALGDALKNKNVKRGLVAAAALSAFGFIYSARKDHTASAVTGPPLMPGGNPYEEGLPAPSMSMQENINTINPVTRGMQYKIYTDGSMEDSERLSSMLNGVVDGPINSTMYNSLPRLGQDPYSQVASSF